MKRTLLILVLAVITAVTVSSCVSSRGGCKSTQGLSGYGSGYGHR